MVYMNRTAEEFIGAENFLTPDNVGFYDSDFSVSLDRALSQGLRGLGRPAEESLNALFAKYGL